MPQVWKWTPAKKAILQEIFLGEETQAKIAEKHRMTLDALRAIIRNEPFQAELQKLREQLEHTLFEADVRYVVKEHRITALAAMAQSAREQYQEQPLLEEKRQIGYDKEHEEPLYMINQAFNKDAHAAFRESLADIAKELGHRTAKTEVVGTFDVTERVSFYLPEPESPPDEDAS